MSWSSPSVRGLLPHHGHDEGGPNRHPRMHGGCYIKATSIYCVTVSSPYARGLLNESHGLSLHLGVIPVCTGVARLAEIVRRL